MILEHQLPNQHPPGSTIISIGRQSMVVASIIVKMDLTVLILNYPINAKNVILSKMI